ncbi:MAG TPA: D-erythronate dehydrogenase [Casimicrobiaceae bacterium]|nr:D-erythronate dehydrogenase [Casimicrobiaceae bacterium]
MRIVITGGAGFLGSRLASAILARGRLVNAKGVEQDVRDILLVDIAQARLTDPRVRYITGDLGDASLVEQVFDEPVDSVFHLAAVVSGEAEQNFDLGWRVNVDATRAWLETCRHRSSTPRFVFTSSVAVFGGALPDVVPDDQQLTPQSSYGAQKAVGEMLVHDYTRKGFIDGRSLRLPTVSVRPGKPNKAASSFASGIIREPLAGVDAACPVSAETRMWLISPRAVVENLIIGHEAPAASFAASRAVNVPGISITVGDMVGALRAVAGAEVASRVHWKPDATIDRIVRTWPRDFDARFGRSLGMRGDVDFASIVRQHIADEHPGSRR